MSGLLTRRRAQELLLPVGVVMALVAGLVWPAPGIEVGSWKAGPLDVTVVNVWLIFLLGGLSIHGVALERRGLSRAVAAVLIGNLVMAPLLAGMAIHLSGGSASGLGLGLVTGFAVMAAVPTTISSAAVTTGVARGDTAWAVGLTIICLFVGSITAPIAVSLELSADASVPPGPLLLRVIALVVIPLVIGYALARFGHVVLPSWTKAVPSLAVIALLWVTVSQSADELSGQDPARLALIVVLVVVAHAVLLGLGWIGSRGLPRSGAIAVLFVTAQKTLPLSLSMIVALSAISPEIAEVAAEAVIVCVLWHFSQLLVDGVIASRLARSAGASTEAATAAP